MILSPRTIDSFPLKGDHIFSPRCSCSHDQPAISFSLPAVPRKFKSPFDSFELRGMLLFLFFPSCLCAGRRRTWCRWGWSGGRAATMCTTPGPGPGKECDKEHSAGARVVIETRVPCRRSRPPWEEGLVLRSPPPPALSTSHGAPRSEKEMSWQATARPWHIAFL